MEYRKTSELKPHPLNAVLYADACDSDLLESIRKAGILTPIVITTDGLIIAGHRRYNAAQMLQHDEVPVSVSPLTDPLDVEEALIETNKQREKTIEQKAREFKRLKEIEAERAKLRMAQGGGDKKTGVQNFAPPIDGKGKSRDQAAAKVGFNSGFQAEKAAAVVDAIDEAKETGDTERAEDLRDKLNNKSVHSAYETAKKRAPLVSLYTGDNESYTPAEYIEAARRVMGSIDTDPASNEIAQKVVNAGVFYGIDDDGLTKEWRGNVWLNPPYSNPEIKHFIEKLIEELNSGRATCAILLTNNSADTSWFHLAAQHATLLCFTRGRISFYKPDGVTRTSPTNGQTFFFFGMDRKKFIDEFKQIGAIMELVE